MLKIRRHLIDFYFPSYKKSFLEKLIFSAERSPLPKCVENPLFNFIASVMDKVIDKNKFIKLNFPNSPAFIEHHSGHIPSSYTTYRREAVRPLGLEGGVEGSIK